MQGPPDTRSRSRSCSMPTGATPGATVGGRARSAIHEATDRQTSDGAADAPGASPGRIPSCAGEGGGLGGRPGGAIATAAGAARDATVGRCKTTSSLARFAGGSTSTSVCADSSPDDELDGPTADVGRVDLISGVLYVGPNDIPRLPPTHAVSRAH